MLKRVGFDRNIKLGWLNKTVEIYMEEKDISNVRSLLDEYLLEQVISPQNRKKTINILSKTWVNVRPQHRQARDKAMELFKAAGDQEKIAIHWSMLLLAYPIFCDIVSVIGKLLELQNEFSLGMVRRRIYEIWGERSTLKYAIDRIVRSITDWGVLEDKEKPGDYGAKEQLVIENKEIELFLIQAYLIASQRTHLQPFEANNLSELFPFKMDLGLEDFHICEDFSLNKMGADIVIGLV